MDVLTAFPSFKKPKTLPDNLRFKRKHLKRIYKWAKSAKENAAKPTFTGNKNTVMGAQRAFSDLSMFGFNKDAEDDEETSEVDESDESEDDEEFAGFEGLEDFGGGMEAMFGNLFSGLLTGDTQKGGEAMGSVYNNMLHGVSGMMPTMKAMFTKDVAYAPAKATVETLGPWIEENRNILTPQQIEKKEKQLSLYKEIIELYDEESDDEEIYEKEARGDRYLQMFQEIEALGPMPMEVQNAANEAAGNTQENMGEILPKKMEQAGTMMTEMMSSLFTGGPGASRDQQPQQLFGGGEGGDCTIL